MLSVLFVYLQVAVANLLAPLRRRALVPARGVTFIEYALLAAIAVIIAALFRKTLLSVFQGLFDSVKSGLSTADSSTNP